MRKNPETHAEWIERINAIKKGENETQEEWLAKINDIRPLAGESNETWLTRVMETRVGMIHSFFWISGIVFWVWLIGSLAYKAFKSIFGG